MSDPIVRDKPKGRGLKIALALSVAVNLAVAGLVGGAVLGARGGSGDEGRGGPPALRTLGLGPFAVALSRDDRAALRARIEAQGTPLREERRAIGDALRAAFDAMRAHMRPETMADIETLAALGVSDFRESALG